MCQILCWMLQALFGQNTTHRVLAFKHLCAWGAEQRRGRQDTVMGKFDPMALLLALLMENSAVSWSHILSTPSEQGNSDVYYLQECWQKFVIYITSGVGVVGGAQVRKDQELCLTVIQDFGTISERGCVIQGSGAFSQKRHGYGRSYILWFGSQFPQVLAACLGKQLSEPHCLPKMRIKILTISIFLLPTLRGLIPPLLAVRNRVQLQQQPVTGQGRTTGMQCPGHSHTCVHVCSCFYKSILVCPLPCLITTWVPIALPSRDGDLYTSLGRHVVLL